MARGPKGNGLPVSKVHVRQIVVTADDLYMLET